MPNRNPRCPTGKCPWAALKNTPAPRRTLGQRITAWVRREPTPQCGHRVRVTLPDPRTGDEAVLFARSGVSHPLGKLTCLAKTVIPESVGDVLAERARAAGMGVTELHREILCRWAYGDEIDRLNEHRRRVALMNGSNSGPENGGES
jgi:hypothetical protein